MRLRKSAVIAGTAIFLAAHLYLHQVYRQRNPRQMPWKLDRAAQHIESRLAEPLIATLADISDKEVDFEAIVSFQPLCESKRTGTRAVYNVTFENRLERVINGVTSPSLAMSPTVTKDLIETTFIPGETTDTCRSVERSLKKKKRTPRESIIRASGQISWTNAPPEYDQCREIDPRFPSTAIRKGHRWAQELAVDPQFNEGGKATARLCVVSTFVIGSQKIVRINRCYEYKMKTALPTSIEADKNTDLSRNATLVRVDELIDLMVETGVTLRQETVQQLYCERFPIFGLGGALTTAKRQLVLKELVN